MKKAGIALVLMAWLTGLSYAHIHVSAYLFDKNSHRDEIMLPPFAELDPQIINIATLGHRSIYDDFIHLWFNHYLVDQAHLQKYPDDAVKIGNLLLRLRPMIETSYMLTCVAFVEDIDRPEYCEPVIQTGMKIFPKSFMLPMAQGYIFYKELEDPVRAAAYYAIAAQTDQAPPHVMRVARKLLNKHQLDESEIQQMMQDFDNLFGKQALLELINKGKEEANE